MTCSQNLAVLMCSLLMAAPAGACCASISPIHGMSNARLPKLLRIGMTLQEAKACFTPNECIGMLENMRHGGAIFVRDGVTTRVEWRRIDGQRIVTKWEVLGDP